MIFVIVGVVVVVFLVILYAIGDSTDVDFGDSRRIIRFGKRKSNGNCEVFKAWVEADLNQMLRVLTKPAHAIDRHYLLLQIVEETYKRRASSASMRRLFEKAARRHIEEFPIIAPAFIREDGELPNVPTYQYLASELVADGKYAEALAVCQKAQDVGLSDSDLAELDAIRRSCVAAQTTP